VHGFNELVVLPHGQALGVGQSLLKAGSEFIETKHDFALEDLQLVPK
jgi:hypothetical protein